MTIHCDNEDIFAYTKDFKYYGKIKHIEIIYYYVKEIVLQGEIILQYLIHIKWLPVYLEKSISQDVYKSNVDQWDYVLWEWLFEFGHKQTFKSISIFKYWLSIVYVL